jgi:hypothetical protein
VSYKKQRGATRYLVGSSVYYLLLRHKKKQEMNATIDNFIYIYIYKIAETFFFNFNFCYAHVLDFMLHVSVIFSFLANTPYLPNEEINLPFC